MHINSQADEQPGIAALQPAITGAVSSSSQALSKTEQLDPAQDNIICGVLQSIQAA
jgi:hypothetical protein